MKSERILNLVLGGLLLLIIVGLAWHEDSILGGKTAEHQPAEGLVVKMRIDTVWIHDTLYTAGPEVVREEVREVPARVDTAAILAAFYTERTLSDTFHLRDVATVRITDKVFNNDIIGRQVDYDLATLDVSYQIQQPRKGTSPRLALSLGAQLGREQAAVMAGLRRKRSEFGLCYDLRLNVPSITYKYDVWQWQ